MIERWFLEFLGSSRRFGLIKANMHEVALFFLWGPRSYAVINQQSRKFPINCNAEYMGGSGVKRRGWNQTHHVFMYEYGGTFCAVQSSFPY
jgi:hypothetical protein